MKTSKTYSPEVRERAVRMVFEHESEHTSQWAAIQSIAEKIGCSGETLRNWVRQAERSQGKRAGLSTDDRARLNELGRRIDDATERGDPGSLEEFAVGVAALAENEGDPELRAIMHYFVANAWSGLRQLNRTGDRAAEWEQPELEKEIFHLRLSLRDVSDGHVSPVRACQILTNLGNALSYVGRPVDAVEYWNRALAILPTFGMALGNRGHGLGHYARLLHDPGHRAVLLRSAYFHLLGASGLPLEPRTEAHFRSRAAEIEAVLHPEFLREGANLDDFSLGNTPDEVGYRLWCLERCLFLNPLNELGAHRIAAADVLSLPGIVVGLDEGPYYAGFFNQMKQEFVSARFLFYEGVMAKEPHFADRDVTLVNTLDYPCYSLAIEKVKVAFRTAYSLFDKIAFFLNHYLGLGHLDRNVSFKTIWYSKRDRGRGISPEIEGLGNNVLRGLFWLSKDLSEHRPGFREAVEPEARDIEELRQHAEHRYLKVHLYAPPDPKSEIHAGLTDTLARSVTRQDLDATVLRMLGLARAALLYLAAAIHIEEARRARERPHDNLVMPMFLDVWEDDWKF